MTKLQQITSLVCLTGVPDDVTLSRIRDVLNEGDAGEKSADLVTLEEYRGYQPVSEMTIEEHFVASAYAAIKGRDLSSTEIAEMAREIADETIDRLVTRREEEKAEGCLKATGEV